MTPLERDVARSVRAFYESLGVDVYSLQDRRPGRTTNTPGLPDLWCMHATLGGFWHELKAPTGKLSPEQLTFQATCGRCGVDLVVGGVMEAAAYLQRRGLVVSP